MTRQDVIRIIIGIALVIAIIVAILTRTSLPQAARNFVATLNPPTLTLTPSLTFTPSITPGGPTLTPTPTPAPTSTPLPTSTLTPTSTPCPEATNFRLSEGKNVDGLSIIRSAYVPNTGLPPCMLHWVHEQTAISYQEWWDGPEDGDGGQAPELCYNGDTMRRLERASGEPIPPPFVCGPNNEYPTPVP